MLINKYSNDIILIVVALYLAATSYFVVVESAEMHVSRSLLERMEQREIIETIWNHFNFSIIPQDECTWDGIWCNADENITKIDLCKENALNLNL